MTKILKNIANTYRTLVLLSNPKAQEVIFDILENKQNNQKNIFFESAQIDYNRYFIVQIVK